MTLKEKEDFLYDLKKVLDKYRVSFYCEHGRVSILSSFQDQCCNDHYNEYNEAWYKELMMKEVFADVDCNSQKKCGQK